MYRPQLCPYYLTQQTFLKSFWSSSFLALMPNRKHVLSRDMRGRRKRSDELRWRTRPSKSSDFPHLTDGKFSTPSLKRLFQAFGTTRIPAMRRVTWRMGVHVVRKHRMRWESWHAWIIRAAGVLGTEQWTNWIGSPVVENSDLQSRLALSALFELSKQRGNKGKHRKNRKKLEKNSR